MGSSHKWGLHLLLRFVWGVELVVVRVACSNWVPPMENEVMLFVHLYWLWIKFNCDYEAHCGFPFALTCNVKDCCWHKHQNWVNDNWTNCCFCEVSSRMHGMCLFEIENWTLSMLVMWHIDVDSLCSWAQTFVVGSLDACRQTCILLFLGVCRNWPRFSQHTSC